MSRASQTSGASFESLIERHHDRALDLGIVPCKIEHNQAYSKVVGGKLIYTKPGISDYSGIVLGWFGPKTCAPLGAEAKSTKKDRLPRSAVEPLQAKYLDAVARAGGLALLLVEFRAQDIRTAIPWLEVPWQVLKSAESLSVADVRKEWQFSAEGCYLERCCPPERRSPPAKARRIFPRE